MKLFGVNFQNCQAMGWSCSVMVWDFESQSQQSWCVGVGKEDEHNSYKSKAHLQPKSWKASAQVPNSQLCCLSISPLSFLHPSSSTIPSRFINRFSCTWLCLPFPYLQQTVFWANAHKSYKIANKKVYRTSPSKGQYSKTQIKFIVQSIISLEYSERK